MRACLSLGVLTALLGCNEVEQRVGLVFPDAFTANREAGPDGATKYITRSLTITSIEPFALKEGFDGVARSELIKCGDLGVFPPTSEYDRAENDIAGIPPPLTPRTYHQYPLEAEWTLPIPGPRGGEDNNPWGAVMVHIEARGQAREYTLDKGLDTTVGDQTLLEGCFCMRTNENADSAEHPLDEAVKNACAGVSVFETGPRDVELEPVMPEVFFLRPRGVTTLTGMSGQVLRLDPGVEVATIECRQVQNQTNCYRCESESCRRLDKKRKVPLRVEVLGEVTPEQVSVDPTSEIVLTNDKGLAVPEVKLTSCAKDFQVRVSLVGRPSENIVFDVRCVDPVRFESTPVSNPVRIARGGDVPENVLPRASTIIPAADGRKATLAVFSNVKTVGARVDLFGSQGGPSLSPVGSLLLAGETPRGIYAFHYDLRGGAAARPVLAVATSSKAPGTPASRELMIVRIYEPEGSDGAVTLREVQRMSGPCPSCGCKQGPSCDSCAERDPKGNALSPILGCTNQSCEGEPMGRCPPGRCFCDPAQPNTPVGQEGICRQYPYCQNDGDCSALMDCSETPCYCEKTVGAPPGTPGLCKAEPCYVKLNPTARGFFDAPDLNADGFADLVLAVNEDLAITTFYSAPYRAEHRVDAGPLSLPPFEQSCQCQSLGKYVQSFAMLQLGGPSDAPSVASHDFVMGDATGAFVRYAEESVAQGPPCSVEGQGAMSQCPPGLSCLLGCGSDRFGRCLRPCDPNNAESCPDPESPLCLELPGVGHACGGPVLGCRAPKSVWQLTGVSDVGAIRLRVNSPYQDLVAVAAGSALPMASDGGRIRILYGSDTDLTNLDRLPQEQARLSILDISPVRDGTGPQGAKSVQVADFNGDGQDDFAVLYGTSEEVRVWLGGSADAPTEITSDLDDAAAPSRFIRLKRGEVRCFPLDRFSAGDLDGDGRAEIVVVCNPEERMEAATIHWIRPSSR